MEPKEPTEAELVQIYGERKPGYLLTDRAHARRLREVYNSGVQSVQPQVQR